MTKIDLGNVLNSAINKAEEDNIITHDEKSLISEFQIEAENLENQIRHLKENNETSTVLKKVISISSKIILKNMISKAREDGRISSDEKAILELIFSEMGYDLNNFNNRPWYNFKICLRIDKDTDMDSLLSYFDKVFCLRGIDPEKVYSGLCLGTKHYVIEDVDVTLLTFAVTPDTTQEWVTKGAFAILDFTPNFERVLHNTAYDLVVENYFSKLS